MASTPPTRFQASDFNMETTAPNIQAPIPKDMARRRGALHRPAPMAHSARMRVVPVHLPKLPSPALVLATLVLAVFMLAWGGGTGAEAAARHHGGVHAAMPCHDTADAPGADGQGCAQSSDDGGHACPDGRCAPAGAHHAAAMPPAVEVEDVAYDQAPPLARPAIRLAQQADTGPPARPPRT